MKEKTKWILLLVAEEVIVQVAYFEKNAFTFIQVGRCRWKYSGFWLFTIFKNFQKI